MITKSVWPALAIALGFASVAIAADEKKAQEEQTAATTEPTETTEGTAEESKK